MAKKMTREEILNYISPTREKLFSLNKEKDEMHKRLAKLDEEIDSLEDFEEDIKAKSGAEIAEAIREGKDLSTFTSKTRRDFENKKEDLTHRKEEIEATLLAFDEVIEETELECLEDEIGVLRDAQQKYLDDFEAASEKFCEEWDLYKIKRVTADGNFAFELDLRLDSLRVRRANINMGRRERERLAKKAKIKKELLAEGWTENDAFRNVKYGPLVIPGVELSRK